MFERGGGREAAERVGGEAEHAATDNALARQGAAARDALEHGRSDRAVPEQRLQSAGQRTHQSGRPAVSTSRNIARTPTVITRPIHVLGGGCGNGSS